MNVGLTNIDIVMFGWFEQAEGEGGIMEEYGTFIFQNQKSNCNTSDT